MTDLHYRALLNAQRARSPLTALMEEPPPPVPPKDPRYHRSTMDSGSRPGTAASGSKRKREPQDDIVYDLRHGRLEVGDPDDTHTPKRSRSTHAGASEGDVSTDDAAVNQNRGLRRKKAFGNLSNLNLRHAASVQHDSNRSVSPVRESKFQEGSLTDKPSERPPSVFTRVQRTNSGNLQKVEELMADYHDGVETSTDPVGAVVEYEKATMDQRVADITARQKKEDNAVAFRFGKSWASSFNPVNMWNRLWSEPRKESQDAPEMDAKARQKAEAEERYAQLKSAGQLGLQPVFLQTPHDSAIALNGPFSTQTHNRTTSYESTVRHSQEDNRQGSEVPESASKPILRTFRSRLHLRTPSLQNLKQDLKRVKSELHLGTAADRESSSSVSPSKAEFPDSAVRKSHSKYDLKRANRLSKRVSDLEGKLQKARSDLDVALTQASPAPKLGLKYERFTPYSSVRKPRFIPGALPTLPSEGVLFPDQAGGAERHIISEARVRKPLDMSKAFDNIDEDEDVLTLRRTYSEAQQSARAEHGFEAVPQTNEDTKPWPLDIEDERKDNQLQIAEPHQSATSEPAQLAEMDPNSVANNTDNGVGAAAEPLSYEDLNTKLNALEESHQAAKKAKKPKKRPSKDADDKPYKPDKDDDADDDDFEEDLRAPKKKRKSTGKNENGTQTKRASTAGKKKSPQGKARRKSGIPTPSPKPQKTTSVATTSRSENGVPGMPAGSDDELAVAIPMNNSVTSEENPLEPVYEEEEETNDMPQAKTGEAAVHKATPYYGRNAIRSRSRSSSPNKRESTRLGAEEKIFTRAGQTAQHYRTSNRDTSPPPPHGHSKDVEVVNGTVRVTPGQGDVPSLPNGAANGSVVSLDVTEARVEKRASQQENFQWPDDVF